MRLIIGVLALLPVVAAADTAYVTDNLKLGLYEAEDTSGRAFRKGALIEALGSGEALHIATHVIATPGCSGHRFAKIGANPIMTRAFDGANYSRPPRFPDDPNQHLPHAARRACDDNPRNFCHSSSPNLSVSSNVTSQDWQSPACELPAT